jgi:dTDP-glucose 4,6-dehydratase
MEVTMKTYLITGGAGFIGSNYIHYLYEKYSQEEIQVINYDLLTYAGNLENLKEIQSYPSYEFIQGDVCDRQKVKTLFETYNIDYVVNFAAESHVDRSIENPSVFIQTNILGTQTLLDVAKKHWEIENGFKKDKKFLQISTDEVYGSLGPEGYFSEHTPISPHSPYSASKASADLIVQSYFDTFGFPMNITRCSNNYGPYQFPEKLIPLMILNALDNKELPIYGDGKNIRDWLYVKDHCRGIEKVLRDAKIGEVYNIGGHNEMQNKDIVELIIEILQKLLEGQPEFNHINHSLITYIEDRKGHDRRYAIDASKIKKDLGWIPNTTFEIGLRSTIKWYINNYN